MPSALAAKSSKSRSGEQIQKHPADVSRQPVPTNPHGAALALQRSAGNHAVNHLLGQGLSTMPSEGAVLQRKCACGNNTMAGGECAECSKKKPLGMQTKLKVNEPGDIYEHEADRIADQVMAAPGHHSVSSAPPRIQRFSRQSNGQMGAAPASVDQTLANPGTPLEPALRQDMEQRFGHDFSRVRVHSDAAAEQSARDVNAQAYTVGHDIVFGTRRFTPGTQEGRRLIAHELTHVMQQSGSDGLRADESNEQRGLPPTAPASRGVARKPLRGYEHVPRLEPEPTISVLRFTDSGLPLTTERLVAWALRRYKEGVRVEELFTRLQSSHEFTGSEDDRANAHMALQLSLREQSLESRVAEQRRVQQVQDAAREEQQRQAAIKHYNEYGPKLRPRRSELLTLDEAYQSQAEGQASAPTRTMAGNAYWNGMTVARYTVVVPPGGEVRGDVFRGTGVFQVDGFFYYRASGAVMDDLFYGATAFADIAWENTMHINVLYGKILQLTGKTVSFLVKGPIGDIAGEALETVGEGMENEIYEIDRQRHGIETKKDPFATMPSPPPRGGMDIPKGPKAKAPRVNPVDPVATRTPPVKTPAPVKTPTVDAPKTAAQLKDAPTLDKTPARGSADHDIEVSQRGIELCSPKPCPLLKKQYNRELKQYPELGTLLDDLTQRRVADPKNDVLRRQSEVLEERLAELKARNDIVDAIPEANLKNRARAAEVGVGLNRQQLEAFASWMKKSKSKDQRARQIRALENQVINANTQSAARVRARADEDIDRLVEQRLGEAELSERGMGGTMRPKPVRPDVDEIKAVGEPGILRKEAMARALDAHDREFKDFVTNRQSKHVKEETGAAERGAQQRAPVSVDSDPSVLISRRFDEVIEVKQVFDEAVAKLPKGWRSWRPTKVKAFINKEFRRIVSEGASAAGRKVRDAFSKIGFEWLPGEGLTATKRSR